MALPITKNKLGTRGGRGPALAFVPPCLPTLRRDPPSGPDWLHEIKFDGWRLQLHKDREQVRLWSKRGLDLSHRFASICDAVGQLNCRSVVIDAEIVAHEGAGHHAFSALHRARSGPRIVWAFDLLHLDGEDLCALPLVERRGQLARLLRRGGPELRFSEEFDDPHTLLRAAAELGLEGIVSKRRDAPYRSGRRPEWIKVKTAGWREANMQRFKLFR